MADLPLEMLIERADELARRWAIELIRSRPLTSIGEIPLAELSSDAPKLLTQTLRAMQSDVELDRLTGFGEPGVRQGVTTARGLAATAGATDSSAAVEAVEAMRGVLWEAMLDELRQPAARQVSDIADRLGYVCSRALAVTIPQAHATLPLVSDVPLAHEPPPRDSGEARTRRIVAANAKLTDAAIMDERADEASAAAASRRVRRDLVEAGELTAGPAAERPLSWDESPPVRPPRSVPEIEIRDERGEDGPAAGIRSIGRELARFRRDGQPFAVLLVETRTAGGTSVEGSSDEGARVAALIEGAIEREIQARGSGSITRETAGRYWLLAPGADSVGAAAVAERVRRAVRASVGYRQTSPEVLIGIAICPDDGHDAPALAAQADVGLYSARSGSARSSDGVRRSSLLASLRSAREDGGS